MAVVVAHDGTPAGAEIGGEGLDLLVAGRVGQVDRAVNVTASRTIPCTAGEEVVEQVSAKDAALPALLRLDRDRVGHVRGPQTRCQDRESGATPEPLPCPPSSNVRVLPGGGQRLDVEEFDGRGMDLEAAPRAVVVPGAGSQRIAKGEEIAFGQIAARPFQQTTRCHLVRSLRKTPEP